MSDDVLYIAEIFFSIQGESTYSGEPCLFVRLSGCDLRCAWCDTTYAFSPGKRMTPEDVETTLSRWRCNLVEITGGEPLLQPAVPRLIRRLLDAGKRVLVETGGHRDISVVDPRAVVILDIKCPDSRMSRYNDWTNLQRLRPQDQIKFVLASRSDYEWARDVARSRRLGERTVLFSPVWSTLEPRLLAEWILEDELPVRLQLPLHKILWGPERRGV
ncbi:MAG TPA: radical SAM protein [Acidobacteriota bacterium]|nr:radical SAM protein [Acidobacteriota bacterium]HRR25990.1 radical SAM protein [Acidobacteriota bacterium]